MGFETSGGKGGGATLDKKGIDENNRGGVHKGRGGAHEGGGYRREGEGHMREARKERGGHMREEGTEGKGKLDMQGNYSHNCMREHNVSSQLQGLQSFHGGVQLHGNEAITAHPTAQF